LPDIQKWRDSWQPEWQDRQQQLFYVLSPLRPWLPMLSAALAFGASFLQWHLLRMATTAVAIILFLFVAYEVSCDLLEPDKGPCDPQRHSTVVPVTPLQIFFAGALAILYTFLICSALHGLVSSLAFQTTWTEIVVIPAVFFIACKAAWRNVRLWSYQSVEYVELLQENRNQLDEIERVKKTHLPDSYGNHPSH
jgi:hypothetical protein